MVRSRPTLFDTGTPVGFAELWVRHRIDRARAREIAGAADLGASVIEWVVISATLVGIATGVGVIIKNKVESAANNVLPAGTGTGGGGSR